LQQLPVRAALFALITHVEITIANAIRREFINSSLWIDEITKRSRAEIEKRLKKAKKANHQLDELHMTSFSDKIDILSRAKIIGTRKEKFKSELNELRNLRNNLAHANEYAADRRSAKRLCATVRKAEWWIQQLNIQRSTEE
jgi:hypothetical protein